MTSKKPGRLDWIETIEVEQVDDDSEIEQQSRSTTRSRSTGGAGSTTPILRKQRTTSSNDHTDDGESSTDDLAGVAIVDRQISNSVRNNNSEQGTTSSEGRFANADTDSQQHRRRRLKLAGLCFLLLLLIIAVVVGGVCGAGKCPRGRSNEISSAQVELHPELYNDICERSVGPLTIGKVPAIGALKTVTSVSSIPTCSGNDSASLTSAVGRWFKVTGGDEVIRASTCNRGEKYVTTMDTTISIFQGDDCGSLTCVATNDDFCGTSSSVSLLAEKGVNYFIFVAKKDNDSSGNNSSSSSFLAASSSTTSSSASFDFVLTVDHEDNGLCVDPIGPLLVADGDVVAGSLRASDLQPLALTCDSNTAQNGVVWYTVRSSIMLAELTLFTIRFSDFPLRFYVSLDTGQGYRSLDQSQYLP